jgi:hypothetical protein
MTLAITNATDLLAKVPDSQRAVVESLLLQYGPALFAMALEEAWAYIRRLLAGDLDVVYELDERLSDDAFIEKVKLNTARWQKVAEHEVAVKKMRDEIALKLAPVILSILAAMVGL